MGFLLDAPWKNKLSLLVTKQILWTIKNNIRGAEFAHGLEKNEKNTNILIIFLIVTEITVSCPGQPGHGSLLTSNTAGERVRSILVKIS